MTEMNFMNEKESRSALHQVLGASKVKMMLTTDNIVYLFCNFTVRSYMIANQAIYPKVARWLVTMSSFNGSVPH